MSKKKNRNRQQKPPVKTQPQYPVTGDKQPTRTDEISAAEDAALAVATQEDLESAEMQSSAQIEVSETEGLSRIKDILKVVETIKKRLEKEREDAVKEKDKAREERENLKSETTAIQTKSAEFEEKSTRITEREAELEEREKTILEREIDANKGFPKRYIEELKSIQQSHEALKEDFALKFKELEEHKQTFSEQQKEAESQWRTKVDEQEAALESREKTLRKLERQMQRDRELLDEDRAHFESRLETAIAEKRDDFELERKQCQERLGNALEACSRTDRELQKLEEVFRCFLPKSPEDILSELEKLKEDKRRLQLDLENRLSSDSQERLQALERDKETADSEKAELQREIARKNSQLAKLNIAATDLEAANRQVDALKANIDLLREAAIEETRKTRELVEGKKADLVFPALSEMDATYSQSIPTKDVSDLKKFSDFVRDKMASADDKRFYDERTTRSFIAGMAMSRLHLLHGISGTGKTSLPLAFSGATGSGCEIIEVQAGWRDRDDLLGYYNSFEKKFYESDFLQALYKAQCPEFSDRPFFIVLDEMNLSHPEQYFADILSALENNIKEIGLMSSGLANSPQYLKHGGKSISLPPNVWFVGTANQDETTKDFADKTYDRAHVMEMKGIVDSFQPRSRLATVNIKLDSLDKLFTEAADHYKGEANAAWKFLNQNELRTSLNNNFEIGWGPRLERQLLRYLPVVLACGGTKGEALDHIIATKILRKMRNRYNNRLEHVNELEKVLIESWRDLDEDSMPEESMQILQSEKRNLGGDV